MTSPPESTGEVDLSLLICPECDRPCDDHDDECPYVTEDSGERQRRG